MDETLVQQIFDELLSSFEPLDTQNAALLQFLKAKGIATDEELAPFLEQAGNASNVRWLAARVRIRSLISSAMKPAERHVETEGAKPTSKAPEPSDETSKDADEKTEAKADVKPDPERAGHLKTVKPVPAVAEKNANSKENTKINSESDTKKMEDAKQDGKENAA